MDSFLVLIVGETGIRLERTQEEFLHLLSQNILLSSWNKSYLKVKCIYGCHRLRIELLLLSILDERIKTKRSCHSLISKENSACTIKIFYLTIIF